MGKDGAGEGKAGWLLPLFFSLGYQTKGEPVEVSTASSGGIIRI